jgi:hypothetical protein
MLPCHQPVESSTALDPDSSSMAIPLRQARETIRLER